MNDFLYHIVNSKVCIIVGISAFLFFAFVLPEIKSEIRRMKDKEESK